MQHLMRDHFVKAKIGCHACGKWTIIEDRDDWPDWCGSHWMPMIVAVVVRFAGRRYVWEQVDRDVWEQVGHD